MVPTTNSDFIVVKSRKNGPYDFLSLGALPVQDSVSVRAANTITRPSHDVWSLTTGEEAKIWFKDNFPRIDFDKLVSDDEWDRFAKAKGTTFPPCQYCPSLQASPATGECGIVLLGDAAHSFSPDIGQGINAGLADVVQLKEILEQSGNISLGAALKEYERVRAPEVRSKSFSSFLLNLAENTKHDFALIHLPLQTRALIRIARFCAPYQYNQSLRKDRLGKKLWTANVALRLLLNKLTFGIFPKQMVLMVNDDMTYRQVARKADLGTAVLVSASILSVLKFLMRRNLL